MDVQIQPRPLSGTIAAPASKSEAHRILICAALADKPTRIFLNASSDDIEATIGCLQALGAEIKPVKGGLNVKPIQAKKVPEHPVMDCRESGSTLRFMLPVAAALCDDASFKGTGRLPQRPLDGLLSAMKGRGTKSTAQHLPLAILGRLEPGEFRVPGDVSSQYVSGLLMALPLLKEGSVRLTSTLHSSDYVNITTEVMAHFGVEVQVDEKEGVYSLPDGAAYHSPKEITVGGDWSNSAFFLAAGALSGDGPGVTVKGLDRYSSQADRKGARQLKRFGAKFKMRRDAFTATPEVPKLDGLRWINVDLNPDLLPILAVMAACSNGEMRFVNGERLRLKESDRLETTAAMIRALGGEVLEQPDRITVTGRPLWGGTVNGSGDHRIVMAAAVAAIRCHNPVIITGAEAVNKSYPGFFDDYRALGGVVDVL